MENPLMVDLMRNLVPTEIDEKNQDEYPCQDNKTFYHKPSGFEDDVFK